jgi:phage gp36-like protein
MGYCTEEDILKLLPEAQLLRLTDDENTGSVNDERVTEAIDSAANEIDTYLGSRYELPLSSTPPILLKMNVDIAIYNLYSRVKEQTPETRKDRYDNAIKFLKNVAEGKISLGTQPPPDPPDEDNYEGKSQVSVRTKVFDSTTMDKY